MSESQIKVWLVHGDCDYLVFKELKETRRRMAEKGISISELDGSKTLQFDEVYNALSASDLFQSSSSIFIRNINNGRSFFPFVEELTNYLGKSGKSLENELYIFNFGKVLKTSKIYKEILKIGEVKEMPQPKPAEILSVIKKSLRINADAAQLLVEYTNSDLFLIRNEIKKLENYARAHDLKMIEPEHIQLLSVRSLSQNDIWGIGSKFLHTKLETKDYKLRKELIDQVEDLIQNNTPVMQIIYSFYQYCLSGIKFSIAVKEGKINNPRDAFSFGYFFAKEFYPQKNKIKLDEMFALNTKILDIEYGIKSGEMDEVVGVRKLLWS